MPGYSTTVMPVVPADGLALAPQPLSPQNVRPVAVGRDRIRPNGDRPDAPPRILSGKAAGRSAARSAAGARAISGNCLTGSVTTLVVCIPRSPHDRLNTYGIRGSITMKAYEA